MQNRRWIMSILDVCCLSETKTFEQFSDFLAFTLSSKNSHQFGQNQPTDKFHHSIESWEWGEEDRTWAGGLRRFWRPPKWRNISLPNSLATVVYDWYLSGMTSLEYWCFACIVFTFGSLVTYVIILLSLNFKVFILLSEFNGYFLCPRFQVSSRTNLEE